jgi:deoxyribonuclease V
MNLKKKLAEAQRRLSSRLILKWDGREVNLMAGADFGYSYKEKKIGASVVVFKIPELEIVEVSEAVREIEVPYLPGFLAYREGPAFLDAFRKIKNEPDVTLVDGNGIAHPRKMGLASYVGVVLDICTIGCAKKPFYPFVLPSEQKGSYTLFKDERKDDAGICLRSRSGVKPIFVSPGHRIDFISAMKLVLGCSKFRIPEPLREAHKRASKIF